MTRRQGPRGSKVSTATGVTTGKATPPAQAGTDTSQVPDEVGDLSDSPLYGVAMLKIAMELKKPNAGELEDILSGVLTRMKLSEEDFRAFLAKNGGLLRAIANKRKY